MLRELTWEQTESAIVDDLYSEAPGPADPAPETRVVRGGQPLARRDGQPDGALRVRNRPIDMLE
eukprot:754303-Alexandrium_andersonii.AAC.1